MNGVQKGIKIFAICLAVFIIIHIVGGILFGLSIITNIGFGEDKIVVENYTQTYQEVEKIDIDTISSNLVIRSGNEFKVEANNLSNYLSSELKQGILKIKEKKASFWSNNSSGVIIVYIPNEITLKELKIDSGAGKIEISNISVDNFDIDQGAGLLEIKDSKFRKVDIDGGAGEIKISESILNDVKMDAGVGKITLEAEITGNSKIECGIGEMNISLLGNKEDYSVMIEKGIGNIKIDGEEQTNNTVYGKGKNKLSLEGGIGNIAVEFDKNAI